MRARALRYRPEALAADGLRSLGGAAVTGVPLVALDMQTSVATVFALLFALFVAFGLRSLARTRTRVSVDDDGIRIAGLRPISLQWSEVDELRLDYYATRRDRRGGWMQLGLKGAKRTVKLDATLEGFPELVAVAAARAAARGATLSERTRANLTALGVQPPDGPETGPETGPAHG